MNMPSTRKEAILLGVKFYFTGKPCKNGHISIRHVRSGCRDCLLQAQYKYRKQNPEKIKQKNKKYNEANGQKKARADAIYRKKNKARVVAQRKAYKLQVSCAGRASQGEWDEFVAEEAYCLASIRSCETSCRWHVDHMIPLKADNVSGLHCASNIQVIPAKLNLKKKNAMIFTEALQWIKALI